MKATMAVFEDVDETNLALVAAKIEDEVVRNGCLCTSYALSKACIWTCLEQWNVKLPLMCYGCRYFKPSQFKHSCCGYLDGYYDYKTDTAELKFQFRERTRDVFHNPEHLSTLFAIYMEKHPFVINAQSHFQQGIEQLLETCLDKLEAVCWKKDRGY